MSKIVSQGVVMVKRAIKRLNQAIEEVEQMKRETDNEDRIEHLDK